MVDCVIDNLRAFPFARTYADAWRSSFFPIGGQEITEAQRLYEPRKGIMDKDTFNTIRRALHPDSRNSISDKNWPCFPRFYGIGKIHSQRDRLQELG